MKIVRLQGDDDDDDEAGSIAARIRTIIARSSTRWLRTVDTRKSAKKAWAKVREVIKGSTTRASDHKIDGLTAQSLNNHYATISTDKGYSAPRPKLTAVSYTHLTLPTILRV